MDHSFFDRLQGIKNFIDRKSLVSALLKILNPSFCCCCCSFILLFDLINRIHNKHTRDCLKKYILRHFFWQNMFCFLFRFIYKNICPGKSKIKMRIFDANTIMTSIQLNKKYAKNFITKKLMIKH